MYIHELVNAVPYRVRNMITYIGAARWAVGLGALS